MKTAIKTIIIGLITLSLLCFYSPEDQKTTEAQDAGDVIEVSVDAAQTSEMPGVLRPGLMGCYFENFKAIESEVKNLKQKPFWRLHLGLHEFCQDNSYTPESFKQCFKERLQEEVDPQIKQFQNNGYQVVISLAHVPRWLSLYPYDEPLPDSDAPWEMKWACSPPKDYSQWRALIKLLVQTQKDDGINAEYIIVDEPDWMFYGTEEQYLELYGHTALAIKEVDPTIKVGASGVSGWESKKSGNCPAEATGLEEGKCPDYDHTMIKALISYVSINNLHLDFIDWHFPGIYHTKKNVETTREWLKEAGLPENMPLTIGEWVLSPEGEIESTEKGSAYVIPLLKVFADSGLSRHTATSIHDQGGWKSGAWQHVGFFSNQEIIKPKWNSFRAIDKLTYESVRIQTIYLEDASITAISSQAKDKSKTQVLISNFIPQDDMLKEYILQKFSETPSWQSTKIYQDQLTSCIGGSKDNDKIQQCFNSVLSGITDPVLKERFKTQVELQICLISTGNLQCFLAAQQKTTDELTKQDIESLKQEYETIVKYQTTPREVTINLQNLPFSGKATLTTYTIDKDHANPCRYNKATESTPTDTECGKSGDIDRAVQTAKDGALKVAGDYLLSLGYSPMLVNELINCLKDPICNATTLICQNYPTICQECQVNPGCKYLVDGKEFRNIHENLFYYGTYTNSDNKTYAIPVSIAAINNDPHISLEGSKKEKIIDVTNGAYSEAGSMQPYAVVLLEIAPLPDTTPPTTPVVTDEGVMTTKTDQLYASWVSSDPESGIAEYQYKITQDSPTGVVIRNWTSTGTTAYVTAGSLSLTSGKTYYFSVKAKNGRGLESQVGLSDGILVLTPPLAPSNPTATSVSSSQIKLIWLDKSTNETGFKIERSLYAITGFAQIATVGANVTTYINSGLLKNKTYYYRVRAYNTAGNSAYSNTASATTLKR